MKKILATLAAVATLSFGSVALAALPYEVTNGSVATPAECTGTYAHTFVAGDNQKVIGTAENDLIIVGSGNSVYGGGGDDCIVGQSRNTLRGEAGNDTLVSRVGQNSLKGGIGTDTAYYHPASDSVSEVENKIAY